MSVEWTTPTQPSEEELWARADYLPPTPTPVTEPQDEPTLGDSVFWGLLLVVAIASPVLAVVWACGGHSFVGRLVFALLALGCATALAAMGACMVSGRGGE